MKKTIILSLALTKAISVNIQAQETKPNVILIYADDMGRGMLSHFGQHYISTPNIDRLFNQGTSFSYAYGCMFSAPARASMLTGYHDCRTDKWNISKGGQLLYADTYNKLEAIEQKLDAERIELPAEDLLLPQVFKKAGYTTAQVGKLEWGFTTTRRQMRQHGWDYYYGYLDHQRCHGFYPPFLFENDSIVHIEGNTHADCAKTDEGETPENYRKRWDMTGKQLYSQNLFLDKILQFIRTSKDEPFFLYHPTQLPHGPVSIPEVHPEVKDNPNLTEIEKEYASMVKMLDDHIGILIKELENLGLLDNTLIVFTVDNGHETYYSNDNRCRKSPVRDMNGRAFDSWDYPYTSELTGDRFDGNNGMSGKKWGNLEGGVRVPLTFYWKGRIEAGRVLSQLISNYDLLPTFADLTGIRLTTPKDGLSLLPLLLDDKDRLAGLRYIYINGDIGPAVYDSEGWKLRYNKHRKEYRLHYLPDDYREEVILNDRFPEVFNRLKGRLTSEVNI